MKIAPAIIILLASACGNLGQGEGGVILVSIDGYRWDYSTLAYTPALDKIASTGVQAQALQPVFPTS